MCKQGSRAAGEGGEETPGGGSRKLAAGRTTKEAGS